MEITKFFTFDAGHRLMHHDGKCHNIHGHTYHLEVTVSGEAKSPSGMVVDYSVLKDIVKVWLGANWDHAMILNSDDEGVIDFCKGRGFHYSTMDGDPTAEAMAVHLWKALDDEFIRAGVSPDVNLSRITLYETPTSMAVYNGPGGI